MTINDKIKQILVDKNITPSYFADEIGVQRSSVSHILSGRNRASFDVIQKIIRRFPELGYEWIMEEEEQAINQPSTHVSGRATNTISPRERLQPSSSPVRVNQPAAARPQRGEVVDRFTNQPIPDNFTASSAAATTDTGIRKAERVIVFYSDGSFQEYIPSA